MQTDAISLTPVRRRIAFHWNAHLYICCAAASIVLKRQLCIAHVTIAEEAMCFGFIEDSSRVSPLRPFRSF